MVTRERTTHCMSSLPSVDSAALIAREDCVGLNETTGHGKAGRRWTPQIACLKWESRDEHHRLYQQRSFA